MAELKDELQSVKVLSNRPIPGSSLSSDPENPALYEQAPKFTSVYAASEDIFIQLTEPEMYMPVMEAVSEGIPILKITQMILFQEFQKGSYNPDLMMMMVEPVTYMIIALAERLDLDMVIEEDDVEDEEVFGLEFKEKKLEELKSAAASGAIPLGMLSSSMEKRMETLPDTLETSEEPKESLLAEPVMEEEEEEAVPNTQSLMAKGI
tara:strand:+ start:669 stop:1289 length:621 start_codon:yes stop_codon:yes gene_type:complete